MSDHSILIMAAVAVVAIVGLVMPFGTSTSGALHQGVFDAPRTYSQQGYTNYGTEVAAQYVEGYESHSWCSMGCMDACADELDKSECNDFCRTQCNAVLKSQMELAW